MWISFAQNVHAFSQHTSLCTIRGINSISTHKMSTVNKHMVVKFMLYGQFYDYRYLLNNVHYICCYCVTWIQFYQHASLDSSWRTKFTFDWQPLLFSGTFSSISYISLEAPDAVCQQMSIDKQNVWIFFLLKWDDWISFKERIYSFCKFRQNSLTNI